MMKRILIFFLLLALAISGYIAYKVMQRFTSIAVYIAEGDLCTHLGEYERALVCYEKSQHIQPSSLIKAKLDFARKQKMALEENLTKANELDASLQFRKTQQTLAPLITTNIEAYLLNMKCEREIAKLESEFFFIEGFTNYDHGDFDQAINNFRQALKYNPRHPQVMVYFRAAHQEQMWRILSKNMEAELDKWLTHYQLANPLDNLDGEIIDLIEHESGRVTLFVATSESDLTQMRRLMNQLYLTHKKTVHSITGQPAVELEILLYPNRDAYLEDGQAWISRLDWNADRDGHIPLIQYK